MYFSKTTDLKAVINTLAPLIKKAMELSEHGLDIELKKHSLKRSNHQNSFYWLNLSDITKTLNEAGCTYGEYQLPYTPETLHEINKRIFALNSTKKLKTKDFCEYMTKMFDFWIDKTSGEFLPKETPENYLKRTGLL